MEKKELRKILLCRRKNLPERELKELRLNQELEELLAHNFQEAMTLGFYSPIRGEPSVMKAVSGWLKSKSMRKAALPVVCGKNLEYRLWTPSVSMKSGVFGIQEPEGEPVHCDLLLIPCVGFNDDCYRLGYGGGYFDRLLKRLTVPTVGVAFEECRTEEFRPETYDMPLDWIVTDKGAGQKKKASPETMPLEFIPLL